MKLRKNLSKNFIIFTEYIVKPPLQDDRKGQFIMYFNFKFVKL